jgi:DNA invertase Pin-like site-specific DNA recombinase
MPSSAAIGYACAGSPGSPDLTWQRAAIDVACGDADLELVEIVGDRAPRFGKGLERPGIAHALQRLAAGDAACIVVARVDHVSESLGELAELLDWLRELELRLISLDPAFDTDTEGGAAAARVLVAYGSRERERVAERTRPGLDAARAKHREGSGPEAARTAELRHRITQMRADGMTLQAIADVLNAEGVPTQRGGAQWRPSSVHTAAGYRRPGAGRRSPALPDGPERVGRRLRRDGR